MWRPPVSDSAGRAARDAVLLFVLQAMAIQPADAGLRAESELVGKIAIQLKAAATALEKQHWAAAEKHAGVACRMQIPCVEEALRLKCEALLGGGRAAEAVSEGRGLTRGGDSYAPEVSAASSPGAPESARAHASKQQDILHRFLRCAPDAPTFLAISRERRASTRKRCGGILTTQE